MIDHKLVLSFIKKWIKRLIDLIDSEEQRAIEFLSELFLWIDTHFVKVICQLRLNEEIVRLAYHEVELGYMCTVTTYPYE
jgi:hypothetical protein